MSTATATRSRIIPLRLKLGALALLVVGGFAYQTVTSYGGPRLVKLRVSWGTTRGVQHAAGSYSVTDRYGVAGTVAGHDFTAAGGSWGKDIVLPGPGTYTIVLAAVAAPAKNREGLYRGAAITCTVMHEKTTRTDVSSSAANDGCSVTLVVVVGPNE